MQVRLRNGSVHEADPFDIALLSQRSELNTSFIYSKDIFCRFAAFVKRQDLDLDQKLIDQWNQQFMEEIVDTDTVHDFIMLAWKTEQMKLMDACCKRAADMLKARLSGDVAELLNLPNPGDDDDEGGDGDEHVEDGDEHYDEDDGDEHDDEDDGDDDGNDLVTRAAMPAVRVTTITMGDDESLEVPNDGYAQMRSRSRLSSY